MLLLSVLATLPHKIKAYSKTERFLFSVLLMLVASDLE